MDGIFFPPPSPLQLYIGSTPYPRPGSEEQEKDSAFRIRAVFYPGFSCVVLKMQGVLEMLNVSKSPPKWPGGGRERAFVCALFLLGVCSRNWRASCALVFLFPTFPRMPLIVRCWLLIGRGRSLELITARRSPTSFSHPCGILGNKRYQLKVPFSTRFGRD